MSPIIAATVVAFAAGCVVERLRGRHRLAQLVDVEAVRAATIDTGQLEALLAEETMRAAHMHRMWKWAQKIARDQAELLATAHRRPIPLGPTSGGHRHRPVPAYGAHRSPA